MWLEIAENHRNRLVSSRACQQGALKWSISRFQSVQQNSVFWSSVPASRIVTQPLLSRLEIWMLGIARTFVTRMRVAKLAFSRCFQNDESCTQRAVENASFMKSRESGSRRYVHTWPIRHTPHIGPPVRFNSSTSPCRTRPYGAHLFTLNRDSIVFRPSRMCPKYGSTKTPKCRPMRGSPALNLGMAPPQKASFCRFSRRYFSNCLNQTP